MKTLVKNGKKYVVTDLLYESLKRKSLLKEDSSSNPLNPGNLGTNTENVDTSNTISGTIQNTEENSKNLKQEAVKYTKIYNTIKTKVAKNLKDFSKTMAANEAYGDNARLFNDLGEDLDSNKLESSEGVNVEIIKKELGNDINNQEKLEKYFFDNVIYELNALAEKALRTERTRGNTYFVQDSSNQRFKEFIKDVDSVASTGSSLLAAEGSMNRYNQLVKKQVAELIHIGRDLNKKVEENNDDTDTNDIDLGKAVKEIFTKDDAIKIITQKAKALNATRKQKASDVTKSVIEDFMNEYIKKLENGEVSVENVDRTNMINYLKMIKDNSDEMLKVMKEPKDKDEALKKAIKQVKQYCDSQDDWSKTTVMSAVSKAASDTGADYETLKKFFDKLLENQDTLEKIKTLYNEAEENTEIMNKNLKYKHEANEVLMKIISNFYNVLSGENILLSNYSTKYNDYVEKLSNILQTVKEKQDNFFDTAKSIADNVNNSDTIKDVLNKINNSKIGNAKDIDNILKLINNSGSSVKEAEQTISYASFDDAERKLVDLMNKITPKELQDETKIQINDTNFEKQFNDIFNKGTIDNILKSYDLCSKISLLGFYLINSEKYLTPGNDKKDSDADLNKALRIFRKYMGRTVSYDDIEEYEYTKQMIDRSLRASKSFITRVKNIYYRLNNVGIRWMGHNKIAYDKLLDFINSSEDSEKVELLKKIIAYDAITNYYNSSKTLNSNDVKEGTTKTTVEIINKIVPPNSSEQIQKKLIDKLNYKFYLPEYSQVQEIYTEILNDEELKGLVNIKQIFKQSWLKQYDRFLIVTDKKNNFLCTLALSKMFGRTRAILDKMKNTRNPKNKVDSFFNSIKDKMSVK